MKENSTEYPAGIFITEVAFHTATVTANTGTEFFVNVEKTLRLSITGTSTSRTINFYGKCKRGYSHALMGVKTSDYSTMASSTTGHNEIWSFCIAGFHSIVIDVTAVAGGYLNILGRAVS